MGGRRSTQAPKAASNKSKAPAPKRCAKASLKDRADWRRDGKAEAFGQLIEEAFKSPQGDLASGAQTFLVVKDV